MKKKSIVYSILLLLLVAGTVLTVFFKKEFIGGCLFGATSVLTLVFWLGQKQLEAAGKRMDKIMKDHQIQLENDNL